MHASATRRSLAASRKERVTASTPAASSGSTLPDSPRWLYVCGSADLGRGSIWAKKRSRCPRSHPVLQEHPELWRRAVELRRLDGIDAELDGLDPVKPWLCGSQNFGGYVEHRGSRPSSIQVKMKLVRVGSFGLTRVPLGMARHWAMCRSRAGHLRQPSISRVSAKTYGPESVNSSTATAGDNGKPTRARTAIEILFMLVIACPCRFANPDHYDLNSGKLERGQKPPCP